MLDPCNYAGAFWNGATYLKGLKGTPVLLQFSPVIALVVLVSVLYLYLRFTSKKQSR